MPSFEETCTKQNSIFLCQIFPQDYKTFLTYWKEIFREIRSCKLICKIPFQHGRLQICLYGQVLHSVSNWFGRRITINFNVKDEIYQFFKNKSKTISYKQSKKGNFKSIVFL